MGKFDSWYSRSLLLVCCLLLGLIIVLFVKYDSERLTNDLFLDRLVELEVVSDVYGDAFVEFDKSLALAESELYLELDGLSNELDIAKETVFDYQIQIGEAQDDLLPYTWLLDSLDLGDDDLFNSNVYAEINGSKLVPVLTKSSDFDNYDYIRDFRMIEELDASIIYTYFGNFQDIIIGEMDKYNFEVLNEIILPLVGDLSSSLSPNVKIVDDGIAVLLSTSVEIYDYDFNLTKTIQLPEEMLVHFSLDRTRAVDGREGIDSYDISSDLKQLVFSDQNGVYLYNRLTKIKSLIMEPGDDTYMGEAGDVYDYKTVHLHPKFYYGYVISEIHDHYSGYLWFYLYNLTTKKVEIIDIGGTQYGYHEAIGPYFTVYSSNNYFDDLYPDDVEGFKHTLIYNPVSREELIHPIHLDWMSSLQNQWGFDGLNASVYLTSYYNIKGNTDHIENSDLTAFYYDYRSQDYLNKSIVFKSVDKSSHTWIEFTILGLLEDNTAIYLIHEDDIDYIFRF